MDKAEIKKEIALPYDDLCNYLKTKYGKATCNYFPNEQCKGKSSKVTRTADGLICHHICEDRGGNLSNPPQARFQPYSWQLAENLVYCNLIEHLILHIKICILRQKHSIFDHHDLISFFAGGGTFQITSDINDAFEMNGTNVKWKQRCFAEISDNLTDYINILQSLITYIKNNTKAISSIVPELDKMLSEDIKRMCKGYSDFYDDIYAAIVKEPTTTAIDYSETWKVDFVGHGFPQFSDELLDYDIYGSKTIDEYLHLGLPTINGKEAFYEIKEKPLFCIGDIPLNIKADNQYNYIIRAKSSFTLKEGKNPFYADKTIVVNDTDDNNLRFKKGIIRENSFHYNSLNKCFEETWKSSTGETLHSRDIIVYIGKNDFDMFFDTYNVKNFDIIDGCYWHI